MYVNYVYNYRNSNTITYFKLISLKLIQPLLLAKVRKMFLQLWGKNHHNKCMSPVVTKSFIHLNILTTQKSGSHSSATDNCIIFTVKMLLGSNSIFLQKHMASIVSLFINWYQAFNLVLKELYVQICLLYIPW